MKLFITGYSDIETGVTEVVLNDQMDAFVQHFERVDFGDGLRKICVILMCQEPLYAYKQRVRMSRIEKILYVDVPLPYIDMVNGTPDKRRAIVSVHLYKELKRVLSKYKLKNFDMPRFLDKLREQILKAGWIDDVAILDP